ncbi:CobW family GTP-binding protein [Castellaniella sp.]|uniref:CobW family GTP-binding protein n=1 Tax=Castellaniella sp. TaxID=1955812 RepID=UPI003C78891D
MMQRIPLVVIGGFLGAGKTTLLNHLLTHAGGRRIGVLVNDFGPVNVDVDLVAAHDGETLSLTNGCVCCSMGSGLDDALIRVLDRRPAMDLIVIEASGVSDPGRIAQVGLSDPMLQLAAVVVMADAEHVLAQLDDPLLGDTLERQIRAASLVVLNKADLVSRADLDAVRARLERQFGGLAMIEAANARVPIDALAAEVGGVAAGASPEAARHAQADHVHRDHDEPDHPFEGGAWTGSGVLDADRLIAALRGLPKTVIRAKGWVVTDRHGPALVHLAGGRVRITRAPQRQGAVANEVVYIGIRGAGVGGAISEALAPLLERGE